MCWKTPLLLLAVAPTPAWAGPLASGSTPGIPWFRLFVSLVFCIALAWGAVLLLRQYQRRGIGNPLSGLLAGPRPGSQRRIDIVETRRVSLQVDLCLVECDGETYFIALTPGSAVVLDRSSRGEEPR